MSEEQWAEHKLVVYEKIVSLKEDIQDLRSLFKEDFKEFSLQIQKEISNIRNIIKSHAEQETPIITQMQVDIASLKTKYTIMWMIGYGLVGGFLSTIFVFIVNRFFI